VTLQPTRVHENRFYEFTSALQPSTPFSVTLQGVSDMRSAWGVDSGGRITDIELVISGSDLTSSIFLEGGAGGGVSYNGTHNIVSLNTNTIVNILWAVTIKDTRDLPINSTKIAEKGVILEPNATNSFTKLELERFIGLLEHSRANSTAKELLIDDIKNNRIPAYKIMINMDNSTYGKDMGLVNGSRIFNNPYLTASQLTDFFDQIENETRTITGDSFGENDNPNFPRQKKNT
jgi:hypothetical protein